MGESEAAVAFRIGTRGSPLALAQAVETRERMAQAHGLEHAAFALDVIKTTGDAVLDRALSELGGKGLFTKEIDEALLGGRIDLAVHSMKDVPTVLPEGMVLAAILPREDVRDAFISPRAANLDALPPGALVGTASLRRQAQVLRRRPDLRVETFRGNVQTRLRKLEAGEADATFLAMAGLSRLGMTEVITAPVETEMMLPAVAQGAIGIACRADDTRVIDALAPLNDPITATRVTAERAFLRRLDGSCRTPLAGLARLDGQGGLTLSGEILTPDGRECHADTLAGGEADAVTLGEQLGEMLLSRAGPDFLIAHSG
ncbi:MAG: hydroxymethylbilane synthase [Pseudomonadota bacterium]